MKVTQEMIVAFQRELGESAETDVRVGKGLEAVLDLIAKEQDSYGVQGDCDGGDLEMQCLKGDGEGGCCAWHIEVREPEADWVTVARLAALGAKHTEAGH